MHTGIHAMHTMTPF